MILPLRVLGSESTNSICRRHGDGSDLVPHVRLEFRLQRVGALGSLYQNAIGVDGVAAQFIGDADHSRFSDSTVADQSRFDLGRAQVDNR